MNWNVFYDILKVISGILSITPFLITFIVKYTKNEKAKKVLQGINQITKMANVFVRDVEQLKGLSSEAKKEWVMTKLNRYAIDENIVFDEQQVSNIVEELVRVMHSEIKNNEKEIIDNENL